MKDILKNPIIQRLVESLVGFVVVVIILFLIFKEESPIERWPEVKKKNLTSISVDKIVSFKIRLSEIYSDHYADAIEFVEEEETDQLVVAFWEAIVDSQYYHPQHDVAIAKWGIQIRTKITTLRIGCYISDMQPDVVVGRISSESKRWFFKSRKLYHWYQKYSRRWLEPEGAQPIPTPHPDPPGGE
ncbi:MAG: hypothetical protein GY801_48285 [bacterium]|nr:hypothetical protein [bacterium]